MTLYLRNDKNDSILEIELWVDIEDPLYEHIDISCSIYIKEYSLMLLNTKDINKQLEMIYDFDELSEIRGWLHEVFFMVKKNTRDEYNSVLDELRNILKKVGDKYDLHLIED